MAEYKPLTQAELDAALAELKHWEVREGWLRREYKTPGFAHTMMLVNTVGFLSEASNHHPDLSVGYAKLTVKLQTHKVHALTHHDVELARKIEEVVTWQPGANAALDGFAKGWMR